MDDPVSLRFGSILLCLFACVCVVRADEDAARLDTVAVTATRAGETDLQETAIAISYFDADDLFQGNLTDVKDLARAVPGMSIGQNVNYAQVFIRGIGTNGVFPGTDVSSTVHYDGVYLSRPTMVFSDFLDIEEIEVLKGPQGALYGRNSIGGTINIKPFVPDNEARVLGSVDIGEFGRFRVAAGASGALIEDKLMLGVSALGHYSDGYVDNLNPRGGDFFNDEDREGARASLRWLPRPDMEFILSGDILQRNESPPMRKPTHTLADGSPAATAQVIGDPWAIDSNFDSVVDLDNYGIHGKYIWRLSDDYEFSSLTARRGVDYALYADSDFTEVPDVEFTINERQRQLSQEFHLIRRNGRLNWLLGAYYFDEHSDVDFLNNTTLQSAVNRDLPPVPLQIILDTAVDTRSWAFFFSGSYALTEKLALTFGTRYTDEEKNIAGCGVSPMVGAPAVCRPDERARLEDHAATPKLGLEYRYNDALFYYAGISQGYKSGGFNFAFLDAGGTVGFSHPDARIKPERLTAWEAGIKSDWLDDSLRLNAAFFYYDYEDLQVQSFRNFVTTISNARRSEALGAELDLIFAPTANLRLDAGISWLDAQYKDFKNAAEQGVDGPLEIDAGGKRLNNAPEWTLNLTARYYQQLSRGGSLTWRLDHYWQDREYYTAGNLKSKSQGAYSVTNVSLGYRNPDQALEVIGYVDNVTNQEYFNTIADFNLNSGLSGGINPPRTWGLKAVYHFQ